ncbi:MAG: sulfotransferase family protein [Phenylobacterium sp.]|uniref:sulfotransferase family protein n=1 Tax=Phenylobacterium sp. TaxID=1871053 RepID=UPI00391C4CFD
MTQTSAKGSPAGRSAYLVLGMHRSGTSAVTQLLALCGADLPANVMPGDEHNAKGYFEPWKIAQFNSRRLRAGTSAWDDVFAFPYTPLEDKAEAAWLREAVELFQDEYGRARHPLLKDPRVTVLLPMWRAALRSLSVGARCVIPVRHPLAVAASLGRRDGFPVEKSVLLWCAYMLSAEAYSRDLPRAFVSYDALLSDWRAEAARIEAAHGAPLPRLDSRAEREIDGFLTADLRHNRALGDLAATPKVGPLAAGVLAWFEEAARSGAADPAALAPAAAEIARMKADFGVFVSPVTRDLDQVRSDLLELRQFEDHQQAHLRKAQAVIDGLLAGD